jgi:hypothetical protein
VFENKELWRAQWVATALWRVVHGEARWIVLDPKVSPLPIPASGRSRDLTGWSGDAPAFLPIYVPRAPFGEPPHELYLWRDTYLRFVKGLSLGERQVLEAYLGTGKPKRLAVTYPSETAPSRRALKVSPYVNRDVVEIFVRLAGLCEVRPLDKGEEMG